MYYLGIDVHKCESQVAVLDDSGDLIAENDGGELGEWGEKILSTATGLLTR